MQAIQKITFGKYPYTYARVSVMKGKLIKKEDYYKLIKMELNSVTKFLETETDYKKEIDELAVKYSGSDLIERALNENLVRTFDKLKRISTKEVDLMVNAFLKRWDVQNIKTILRGKYSDASIEQIELLIIPAGTISRPDLTAMAKMDSFEKILEQSGFIEKKNIEPIIKSFRETGSIMEMENALDKAYLTEMFNLAGSIPQEGEFFKKFLMDEMDMMNLKTLMRLKREKMEKEKIMKYLLFQGHLINRKKLVQMAECTSLEEMFAVLKETKFSKILKSDAMSLTEIELELDKFHISHSALHSHQNPLSIHTILSFMLAKNIEVLNLKRLVKARQLGISQEVIENRLLV